MRTITGDTLCSLKIIRLIFIDARCYSYPRMPVRARCLPSVERMAPTLSRVGSKATRRCRSTTQSLCTATALQPCARSLLCGLVQPSATVGGSADHLRPQATSSDAERNPAPLATSSEATERIPLDTGEHVTSIPRLGPYQFEALQAQIERAKMEHAELTKALQASQACELDLEKQVKALRAQLWHALNSGATGSEGVTRREAHCG
jgi:hypothetical protein